MKRLLPKRFGLGDAVALVAQPIARAVDAVAGTKIAQCGGCKKRRAALNRITLQRGTPTSERDSTADWGPSGA